MEIIYVRDFIFRLVTNPGEKIAREFVEKLEREEVLSLFIDKDKIQELNSLLESRIHMSSFIVDDGNYMSTFIVSIMTSAVSYLYKRDKNEVTESLIKASIESYINNVKWAEVFGGLYNLSNIATAYAYKKHIEAYKESGASEEDIKKALKLYKAAIPTGKRYKISITKWRPWKSDIRKQFDILECLDAQYIDDVFVNIQHYIGEEISSDLRDTIHMWAKYAVKRLLFAQALDELQVSKKEATPEQMRDWMTKVKAERKVYIMAMYYLMCMTFLISNK